MVTANRSGRRVVVITLDNEPASLDLYCKELLASIVTKANVEWGDDAASALGQVQRSPPPTAVLLADAALTKTRHRGLRDAVLAYVRGGGMAIAMGMFSSSVRPLDIRPFFAAAGLDWQDGAYHRTIVTRNPAAAIRLTGNPPPDYSQKGLYLKGVEDTAVLYHAGQEAAIALAPVGAGRIGYVADCNAESETSMVILSMIGLLG